MNAHANRAKNDESGFTLVEVMVSAMLVVVFFASIFELNAVCLRYINSSKESLAALQSVQDRTETLRNLAFTDLTSTAFVQDLMAAAANYTPPGDPVTIFSKKATEVVRISKYPTPDGVTQFTRTPNGHVALDSTATSLGAGLVKVDVSVSWNMTAGGRVRAEQTTSLVSNGTKK
jgi:type II secretory pathway pseudopilin PulG